MRIHYSVGYVFWSLYCAGWAVAAWFGWQDLTIAIFLVILSAAFASTAYIQNSREKLEQRLERTEFSERMLIREIEADRKIIARLQADLQKAKDQS